MSASIVIYTRYSSDMQREDSCEDQKREVCRGLVRFGIDAQDGLVIEDKAESGTKTNRVGFEKLSPMIKRGEVSILAVDDQSRLSRADNASSFITDLVYSGGRYISTGEGIDTDQEGWQLRVKIMEVHNGAAILDLDRRVHRGQEGRVLDDGAAGDHPFGYESFRVDPNWAQASRRGPKARSWLARDTARSWFSGMRPRVVGSARSLGTRVP
jgi:site-specific DNA recombinase